MTSPEMNDSALLPPLVIVPVDELNVMYVLGT